MAVENRLGAEKSAYLREHRFQKIDWYPWGEDAFKLAKRRNVPIFLSIGYSTCHYCHLMSAESFSDDKIAHFLNENFVSVKVDRDERPDIDHLYSTYISLQMGRNGWPATVFLTPELKPFVGGTYYPAVAVDGRTTTFGSLLQHVARTWHAWNKTANHECTQFTNSILSTIGQADPLESNSIPCAEDMIEEAYQRICKQYDPEFGGFDKDSKFPRCPMLNFLISICSDEAFPEASAMVNHTLDVMSNSSLYDRIGHGFHRYAVDREWRVPHFEKTLSDQAQLIVCFSLWFRLTGQYEEVLRGCVQYVEDNLLHEPSALYFNGQDADTLPDNTSKVKQEGAYYLWTFEELERIMKKWTVNRRPLIDVIARYFGVCEEGNLDNDNEALRGKNLLTRRESSEIVAAEFGISQREFRDAIAEAIAFMTYHRGFRPAPDVDEKVVAGYQGLMLTALSHAYLALFSDEFLNRAHLIMRGMEHVFLVQDGTMCRVAYPLPDGELEAPKYSPLDNSGFVSDYAFYIQGLLDLYFASLNQIYLQRAIQVQAKFDEFFLDTEKGGYFFSRVGMPDEPLGRLIEVADAGDPSANGVALMNLVRLYELIGDITYRDKIVKHIKRMAHYFVQAPTSSLVLLQAYSRYAESKTIRFVIVGPKKHCTTDAFIRLIQSTFITHVSLIYIDSSEPITFVERTSSSYADLRAKAKKPTVFICREKTCMPPITTIEELQRQLNKMADTLVTRRAAS